VSSLAALAGILDSQMIHEVDRWKAAQTGLNRLTRFATPYLLIYDNVESPEILDGLVPSTSTSVLLTTRWSDWGGRAEELRLDVLGANAATEFLQKRAKRRDAAGAARVASALGHLPLALDHAGAYCLRAGETFDTYLIKIIDRIGSAPKGAPYPTSVAATFSLAIEKATIACPAAEKMLGFFAVVAPEQIPVDLLIGEFKEEDRNRALTVLTEVSLVEHDLAEDGTRTVTVHRLVQAVMRARLFEQGEFATIAHSAARRLAAAFPDNPVHSEDVQRAETLIKHIHEIVSHVASGFDIGLKDRELLETIRDLSSRAIRYAKRALEIVTIGKLAMDEYIHILAYPALFSDLNDLPDLIHGCESFAECEHVLRETMAYRTRTFGDDHAVTARARRNLAVLLLESGRIEEASGYAETALAVHFNTLGPEHPWTKVSARTCADALAALGQPSEAVALRARYDLAPDTRQ
jgi:hypothetical protein